MLAHFAAAELVDALHKAVQEVTVVAHHYHRAVEVAYGLL